MYEIRWSQMININEFSLIFGDENTDKIVCDVWHSIQNPNMLGSQHKQRETFSAYMQTFFPHLAYHHGKNTNNLCVVFYRLTKLKLDTLCLGTQGDWVNSYSLCAVINNNDSLLWYSHIIYNHCMLYFLSSVHCLFISVKWGHNIKCQLWQHPNIYA